jgi:hypothetical protein
MLKGGDPGQVYCKVLDVRTRLHGENCKLRKPSLKESFNLKQVRGGQGAAGVDFHACWRHDHAAVTPEEATDGRGGDRADLA